MRLCAAGVCKDGLMQIGSIKICGEGLEYGIYLPKRHLVLAQALPHTRRNSETEIYDKTMSMLSRYPL